MSVWVSWSDMLARDIWICHAEMDRPGKGISANEENILVRQRCYCRLETYLCDTRSNSYCIRTKMKPLGYLHVRTYRPVLSVICSPRTDINIGRTTHVTTNNLNKFSLKNVSTGDGDKYWINTNFMCNICLGQRGDTYSKILLEENGPPDLEEFLSIGRLEFHALWRILKVF